MWGWFCSNIRGLDLVNVKGNIIDSQGQIANDYQGELTVTFYDKEIDRTTLGNDGTTDNLGNQILLNFKTLGETLFRGKSSVVDGEFDFDFIVPKDVGMEVDFGKFSFYSKQYSNLKDNNGYDLTVRVGGINENAEEDNLGPEIELFMNDTKLIKKICKINKSFKILKLTKPKIKTSKYNVGFKNKISNEILD